MLQCGIEWGAPRYILCNDPFQHTPNPSRRHHKLAHRGERCVGKSPLCPARVVARGDLGVCDKVLRLSILPGEKQYAPRLMGLLLTVGNAILIKMKVLN
jgi:hypothetical protein